MLPVLVIVLIALVTLIPELVYAVSLSDGRATPLFFSRCSFYKNGSVLADTECVGGHAFCTSVYLDQHNWWETCARRTYTRSFCVVHALSNNAASMICILIMYFRHKGEWYKMITVILSYLRD